LCLTVQIHHYLLHNCIFLDGFVFLLLNWSLGPFSEFSFFQYCTKWYHFPKNEVWVLLLLHNDLQLLIYPIQNDCQPLVKAKKVKSNWVPENQKVSNTCFHITIISLTQLLVPCPFLCMALLLPYHTIPTAR
jgi:hypothetical protein